MAAAKSAMPAYDGISFSTPQQDWDREKNIWKAFEIDGGVLDEGFGVEHLTESTALSAKQCVALMQAANEAKTPPGDVYQPLPPSGPSKMPGQGFTTPSSMDVALTAAAAAAEVADAPTALGSAKRRRFTEPGQREDARRGRNRLHAKRSRLRKKFLLQNMEFHTRKLLEENRLLKEALATALPKHQADELLKKLGSLGAEGSDGLQLFGGEAVAQDKAAPQPTPLDCQDFMLVQALKGAQHNFVITNPSLPDNPIVFASDGFYALTGYEPAEVVGRNCRFLQGPKTDTRAVQKIRDSLTRGEDAHVCLLNYRKDGSTFYNQFFIAPLRGKGSYSVENFIGVQCPVSEEQFEIFQRTQWGSLSEESAEELAEEPAE